MFSVQQKRDISDAVQKILRATSHPELPSEDEIRFNLHVDGAESWSWADIQNNGAVGTPGVNLYNELMALMPEEGRREMIKRAQELTGPGISEETKAWNFKILLDRVEKLEELTRPDPRATPDNFLKEMLTAELNKLKDRLFKLEEFLTIPMEDNLIQRHDKKIRALEDRVTALETVPDVSFEPIDLRLDQIESVAEDRAEDAGQLRMLVNDLNNASGSLQDQVNDLADEIKKLQGGE